MLAKARASQVRATWIDSDVESWAPPHCYDVIFSNATLHWIPNHRLLLPKLMSRLRDGGVFAFQVPHNFDAPSHVLMRELASERAWAAQKLSDARRINVELPETYSTSWRRCRPRLTSGRPRISTPSRAMIQFSTG